MDYLELRPYRAEIFHGTAVEKELLTMMKKRFSQEFDSYWQQFGYEIGGPVCYAYSKWLSDEIDSLAEITDVAFVARDGYLIEKIFRMLPHQREVKTHYIYAPRSVKRQNNSKISLIEYRNYLEILPFGDGTIATVDSITMLFSSQRLIAENIDNPVTGFYWFVLDKGKDLKDGLQFQTFQPERYHTISCWNLMEYIMTSPEPPIQAVQSGLPVYYEPNAFEMIRPGLFVQMEQGILEFAKDCLQAAIPPTIPEKQVTKWVNTFLANPTKEDLAAFAPIMFSELADHSDCIPLDPFTPHNNYTLPKIKDRIWLYSQKHPVLYSILHHGKMAAEQILRKNQKERN